MPHKFRFSSISLHDLLTTYAPFLLVLGVLLWVAYVAIDPTPPRKVVMAAGVEGSAYQDFAAQYRAILARYHIDLEIRSSEGSMQNLHRLNTDRSDADVAFVQSGTTNDEVSERHGLVSLGSLFVEPVWIFYRDAALTKVEAVRPPQMPPQTSPRTLDAVTNGKPAAASMRNGGQRASVTSITQLAELQGLSLNVGPKGSGGPRLALQLFEANRVDRAKLNLTYLEDTPAVMKLLDGSLDAMMFVTAPDAPLVQMLLQTPGIGLFNFDQAEAYARRLPFLTHVVLPRGIVALERNIPHHDVQLIAPTATLVARGDLHPAIIELLMQAATQIHGGPGWFRKAGEFPNDQYTEVPVSPVAERFFKSGPPFLQRYLPFWLANLIERMGIILVPIVALLIPLSRVLPPLYNWRVRSRVYRWYGQLRAVENDIDSGGIDGAAGAVAGSASEPVLRQQRKQDVRRARQLKRLADIEAKVNHLIVPLSYAGELYALKLHIDRVRDKLEGRPDAVTSAVAHPSGGAEAVATG